MNPNYSIIIPTYNGGDGWRNTVSALQSQAPKPNRILIIDSGSTDGTDIIAASAGLKVIHIKKEEFDHGGTRQMAARLAADTEFLVYLTQDAILSTPDSLARLLSAFANHGVGAAYGRQIPRVNAGYIEAHARIFNYPERSELRTLTDSAKLGIKAAFISNSFAAYRTEALFEAGGFPNNQIIAEDMIVVARMLQIGWAVAYVADSVVRHSHDYTFLQEFNRYFDIGVMHQDQAWLLKQYGEPNNEGVRFVRSELAYLLRHSPLLLPVSILHVIAKYTGYKLGRNSLKLPVGLKRKLSMNPGYWRYSTELDDDA